MGRFASNDFSHHANRDNWKYPYKGSELFPFAVKKYNAFKLEEENLRTNYSKALANIDHRMDKEEDAKIRKRLDFVGEQREKVSVWVHQFKREPEREFDLDLSDITYFDIAPYEIG